LKLQAGQVIAGRYQIDQPLGSGGMAVVYRALDTKLDRYVALKILREELAADAEFVKRFPIEAMAAAALSHPNIVSIYDYGQDHAIYYIVLEYVDGSNLKDIINHHAPFDNEATLGMALQIADGLAAAHRAQIIHRDIKPHNILVTNNSNAKVADFGIARVAKSGTITTGDSMGSAQYFSPEQARGGYVDHKTDIYSLGIVMYEMATGQLPFDGDNVVTVALMHINDPLPDMLEVNPNISGSVVRIIEKATDKSPAKRYQSIEEMADDLSQALTAASSGHEFNAPASHSNSSNDYDGSYDDDFYDDEDYEDDDTNVPPPKDKKTDRTVILAGVGLGFIFALLIILGSCSVYNRFSTVRITPPNVIGMTYEEAADAANSARLNVNVIDYIFHNEVPEGQIIYQSPTTEHTNMAPGDYINVHISLGPSIYAMPDVVGMHIDNAMELLSQLPIDEGNILVMEQDDDSPAGTIILQEPEADTPVGEGTIIIIYTARDAEEHPEDDYVLMPNLIGRNLTEAQALLEAVDLTVDIVLHDESTTFAVGMIFLQNPQPGTVIERGSVVGFTVSTGSPLPPTPEPTPEPEEEEEDPDTQDSDPYDPNDDTPEYPEDLYTPPPYYPGDQPTPIATTLLISLWDVPEDTETVHIRVTRQPIGGTLTTVANAPASVNAFPMPMLIQGNGIVIYRVYTIVDSQAHFIRAYEINFDDYE